MGSPNASEDFVTAREFNSALESLRTQTSGSHDALSRQISDGFAAMDRRLDGLERDLDGVNQFMRDQERENGGVQAELKTLKDNHDRLALTVNTHKTEQEQAHKGSNNLLVGALVSCVLALIMGIVDFFFKK